MIADFIPTRLHTVLRNLAGRCTRIYSTYEEALSHCPPGAYDSAAIAAMVRSKTERMRLGGDDCDGYLSGATRAGLVLSAVTSSLVAKSNASVRVLDFGGGCGAHYFEACRLSPRLRFDWCVVETAQMIQAGRALRDAGLQFTTDIGAAVEELGGVDLLYSSGTLQYLSDPLSGLVELLQVGAPAIALTRLALTDGQPFTLVQRSRLSHNGPGPMPHGMADGTACYPVTFVNRSAFESALGRAYSIAARFRDESADYRTPRGLIRGSSYICLRNEDVPS